MESTEYALEVDHLTKQFGKFTAVHDLNLTVKPGEFMGLLGPNGAGKSTTLKCITGMLRPTSGEIRISGIDTEYNHRESLSRVGCVIETPEFYSDFTPAEVLNYVGKLYGLPRAEIKIRAVDVLEIVRLWDWRNKKISGFSKGMRQRVALAQALISNPELIILDEPTSGLDPRGMIEMREVLNNLKNGERSLIISTHILKEVSEMCDYVTMINHGTTMISGKVDDLVNQTLKGKKEFTIEVETLKPPTPEAISELKALDGVNEVKVSGEKEISIRFKGDAESRCAIADTVVSNRLGLLTIKTEGDELENLYMELTREEEVNIK